MDFDQLKLILNLVREHELSEFEIEHDGLRLRVHKDRAGAGGSLTPSSTTASVPALVQPDR